MAIIGANSQPMQRELVAVQRMAQQAGVNITRGLENGGGHGGKSGAIRESIVMLREIGRGNWSRVPGSFSILLQQMGVLNKLTGSTASTSRILADAWQAQSEKAHLAAIAATRKAAASAAAFAADEAETTATLEQAVADETAAGAAIQHAQALRLKAVAAGEAAAAETVEAAASVGTVGVIGSVIAGVAIAVGLLWYRVKGTAAALEDLKKGDFTPTYIAKHLQGANAALEGQKKINEEVRKTAELYNSAAEQSKRLSEESKHHFEHLRQMNEFEKNPQRKAANELRINAQERAEQIKLAEFEKQKLERESLQRKKNADAIKVTSKEQDEQNVAHTKANADEAEKFLKTHEHFGTAGDKFSAVLHGGVLPGQAQAAFDAAQSTDKKKVEDARTAVEAHKAAVETAAANDELRKRKEELTKGAAESAARATGIGLSLPTMKSRAAQVDKEEAELSAKKLLAEQKNLHGNVNSLQRVGAFAGVGTLESLTKRSVGHLASIDHQIKNLTSPGSTTPAMGGKY